MAITRYRGLSSTRYLSVTASWLSSSTIRIFSTGDPPRAHCVAENPPGNSVTWPDLQLRADRSCCESLVNMIIGEPQAPRAETKRAPQARARNALSSLLINSDQAR